MAWAWAWLCTCLSAFTRYAEISPLYLDSLLKVKCVCVCACTCTCAHARTQLYPTLCNHMDSSPPGSSVHGILQARILAWVAISSSRGSSRPRYRIVGSNSGKEKDPSRLSPVSRGHGHIRPRASPGTCTLSSLDHVHPSWTALAEQTPPWSRLPGPLLCFTEI